MSNGINQDYKSTVIVMFKLGGNFTTKSIETKERVEGKFKLACSSSDPWVTIVTGDEDDTNVRINAEEVAFFAVSNYADEETLRNRILVKQEAMKEKVSPANTQRILTPFSPPKKR